MKGLTLSLGAAALVGGCAPEAELTSASTQRASLEAASWVKVSAPAQAASRMGHAFVYDRTRAKGVVFGGRKPDDTGASLSDTGLWDGSWTPVVAPYGRRGYVTAAFDTARGRTVVFGGADLTPTATYYDDTWEHDGEVWVRRAASAPLGKRASYAMAYDAARGVTMLFGGYDMSWKSDLWSWNGSSWLPGCVTPPCSTSPRPAARASATFVYDEARRVIVLFGGFSNGRAYDDTWTWDGQLWRELTPSSVPRARDSAAATFDPISQRVLMFGGTSLGVELNDLWAWDGEDWTEVVGRSTPVARQGAGLAFDTERRRAVLFGGRARATATDVWELTLTGNACEGDEGCYVGSCVGGSCLEAPASGGSGGSATTAGGAGNGGTVGGGAAATGAAAGGGAAAVGGSTAGGSTGGGDDTAAGGVAENIGDAGAGNATASGGAGANAEGGGATDGEPPAASAGERGHRDVASGAEGRSFYSCSVGPSAARQSALAYAILAALLLSRRRPSPSADA